MARFNRKLGEMIRSKTLEATAVDSRNDCLATAAVLAAGMLEHFMLWRIDGWMGLAVATFILCSGWKLMKETVSQLLGERADPDLRRRIAEYLISNEKVLGYHDLMIHDYGPGRCFASVHVEMDKDDDPLMCHQIIDDMERECLKNYGVHLVIHYDPVVTDDPEQERLRTLVTAILRIKDGRLSVHDFRAIPKACCTNLIFDVALPMELQGQEEVIRTALETTLRELTNKNYEALITFDPAVWNE